MVPVFVFPARMRVAWCVEAVPAQTDVIWVFLGLLLRKSVSAPPEHGHKPLMHPTTPAGSREALDAHRTLLFHCHSTDI